MLGAGSGLALEGVRVPVLLACLILRWPAAGSLLFNTSPRRLDRH